MAAGWARHLAGDRVEAFAAGTRPQGLNPKAVAIMQEVGVDISSSPSVSVLDFLSGEPPDFAIAVCSEAGRDCPAFPANVATLRWSFEDPAAARGSAREVEACFRRVRDEIRERVASWLAAELGIRPPGRTPSERTA